MAHGLPSVLKKSRQKEEKEKRANKNYKRTKRIMNRQNWGKGRARATGL